MLKKLKKRKFDLFKKLMGKKYVIFGKTYAVLKNNNADKFYISQIIYKDMVKVKY